ncbi:MAG: DNA polymerase I [Deltaproteobacteria bacterium]|nr:DNA polymerase I [Deltaproteobacteria bacterium]
MRKLYIVDGSSYFFRAYFAVTPLSTSKGLPTNAIFGFSNMLLKLIQDFRPQYLAIAFDTKARSFRKEMYEDYKANREEMPDDLAPQIPYIKRVVEAFEIPVLQKEGFEADDIIATLVKRYEKEGWEIVIISADKDLMQLVNEKVMMFDTMRNKKFDTQAVQEKFGVPPRCIMDVLALAGDSSDNIPGVPNIGIKTAAKLLSDFGSLDEIYKHLDKLSPKQKESLTLFKENAYLSRDLVRLDTNVEVKVSEKDLSYSGFNQEKLSTLFKELEFNKLIKDLGLKSEKQKSLISYEHYTYLKNKKEWTSFLKKLFVQKAVSFDFETTGLNTKIADLVGVSFAFHDGFTCYVPIGHKEVPEDVEQVPLEEVLQKLKPFFESESIKKIGQNLKYEYHVLKKYGISLRGIQDDTMISSYLINPEMAHNLDALALQYLNHQNITYDEVVGNKTEEGKKKRKQKGEVEKTFADVDLKKAYLYACEDADVTLKLSYIFREKLKELELLKLYEEIEVPLIPILGDMEHEGIKLDIAFLNKLSHEMKEELQGLEKKIFEMAGTPFNISSPKQLSQILFEKLKMPILQKTKTGPSTNEAVLKKLSEKYELPTSLLNFRELSKLKSTYVDALMNLADPKTHRVHTSYQQTIVATGRLSSTNPNLQNIPIRTPRGKQIRKAFIAQKGSVLLSCDYSQVELRILAHLSQDEALVKAFKSGEDIHSMTAQEIFQKKKISEEERRIAKAINFGIIYGQSSFGLAHALKIPQEEAASYIEAYFKKYHGVHEFIQKTLYEARKTGFTTTLLGRRRYHPNLRSPNEMLKRAAERVAVNAPIQGSASDLIKKAMISLWKFLKDNKYKTELLLQVHDELILEIPHDEEKVISPKVVHIMENALKLSVPLKVDLYKGENWDK